MREKRIPRIDTEKVTDVSQSGNNKEKISFLIGVISTK